MARRRSRRRIAITALVAAVFGAVVGLAVTGPGEPASALRLLSGGAWLGNGSTGTVSHVNGYSGGTDAQAVVGKPGDPFEVVQRADGAYVLDLRTGRLSRLDDSTLAVATTRPKPARPPLCRSSPVRTPPGSSTTPRASCSSSTHHPGAYRASDPARWTDRNGHHRRYRLDLGAGPRAGGGGPGRLRRRGRSPPVRPTPATPYRSPTPATGYGRWTPSRRRRSRCRTRPSTRFSCRRHPVATSPLVAASASSPELAVVAGPTFWTSTPARRRFRR